ncbi:hypothetical protein PYCC9005_002257 [Savitreella phatthalungensis]
MAVPQNLIWATGAMAIAVVGTLYGATLKEEAEVTDIRHKIDNPAERLKELRKHKEKLIAARLLSERKLINFLRKLDEKRAKEEQMGITPKPTPASDR